MKMQSQGFLGLEIETATCASYSGHCSCAQDLSDQHPQQELEEFCAFSALLRTSPPVCVHTAFLQSPGYIPFYFLSSSY